MLFLFLKECARMILSFSTNELITSYESERVPSNFIQLHIHPTQYDKNRMV